MYDKSMTAKDYLSQAYRIDQRINAKLEQVARLRSLTQRVTTTFDSQRVSRTRDVTSTQTAINRLIEAEEKVNKDIDAFIDCKREIQEAIDYLEDDDCRLLLELRYLCMKCWDDIAIEMHISRAHVYRLHNLALAMTEESLEKRRMQNDASCLHA